MGSASITVSLDVENLAAIDELVEDGEYEGRSHVINAAVGELLDGGD